MQLKVTTDYAIRTLLYLAEKKRLVTTTEISSELSIPKNYLPKILGRLRKEHLVNAHSGVKGGFILARRPENISIYRVISIMENTTKINRCLEPDHFCSRCATKHCSVHNFFEEMQEEFETKLKETTIETLLETE